MFVGKPRLAETRLYWRSERQISSQHWTFFFPFSCCGSSWEPRTTAVSKSWLLPLSNLLWCEDLRTDFTNRTEHHWAAVTSCRRLNRSHSHGLGLWTQLWRHDRLAHITQSAVPLAMETSGMSVCERSLPLFWGVKTIRHLYCPFPGWALTHPVYWKEFNRRQLGPYGAWSHPKSLVMIALFYTGCSLHALTLSFSRKIKMSFCHYTLWCVISV